MPRKRYISFLLKTSSEKRSFNFDKRVLISIRVTLSLESNYDGIYEILILRHGVSYSKRKQGQLLNRSASAFKHLIRSMNSLC